MEVQCTSTLKRFWSEDSLSSAACQPSKSQTLLSTRTSAVLADIHPSNSASCLHIAQIRDRCCEILSL